jgi:hypothetical protein
MKGLGASSGIVLLCLLLFPAVVVAQAAPPNCGDGVIQWKQQETCDPPGSVCGSRGNPSWRCNDLCRCVFAGGFCGDGMVNGREQCEVSEDCENFPREICDECHCIPDPDGFCGDRVINWRLGEECEPFAGLDRCGLGRVCIDCRCVPVDQFCGDGIIQWKRGEECEIPPLDNCGRGRVCQDCLCVGESPVQACCFFDSTCQELLPDECVAFPIPPIIGGVPQGPGTECTTVDCAAPQACCDSEGQCTDILPGFCLPSLGAASQGPGTECATVDCASLLQACCLPDGQCAGALPLSCEFAGGTPQGEGSNCTAVSCPPAEACCLPDGECLDGTPEFCVAQGGTPQGEGTDCATASCPQPTEACCLADGTCQNVPPDACEGVSQGLDTACQGDNDGNDIDDICEQPRACCLPSGECQELSPSECLSQNGGANDANITCDDVSCVPFEP